MTLDERKGASKREHIVGEVLALHMIDTQSSNHCHHIESAGPTENFLSTNNYNPKLIYKLKKQLEHVLKSKRLGIKLKQSCI